MYHSLLTFCQSLLRKICSNEKRHHLITLKVVTISMVLIFTTLCNGSDQKPETLKQLIDLYDPTSCQECHMKKADHTCPPNFNGRKDVSERLRQALPMEVNTLSYQLRPGDVYPIHRIVRKLSVEPSSFRLD